MRMSSSISPDYDKVIESAQCCGTNRRSLWLLCRAVVALPTVSVVVPTRNRVALLSRTLRSALAQESIAVEVVVVDDGSTDDTPTMLAGLGDPRLRWVRSEGPRGVSAARNRGIAEARGDWIALLDDDDIWAPQKLVRQLDAADRQDRVWSYTGAVAVDESLSVVGGGPPPSPAEVLAALPFRNAVPAGSSNVMVRRDILERSGTFDESLRHMADWDLWIRLGRHGLPAAVDEPMVAYLLHSENASLDLAAIPAEMAEIERRYRESHGPRVDRAYVYRWMAWSARRAGDRLGAARWYLRAVAEGDVKSLARIWVAMVQPDVLPRRYGRRGTSARWVAGAEAWLAAHWDM
jgi:glycosyltransferase involved in cell wall biosynthesis